ncbi:MAG: hypothetical protein IE921_14740 [Rhodobacteraceae bacterium]|nr:hypothetical protein [Paracoccaceae bacterium]
MAGVFRTIAQNAGNLVLAELVDSVSDRRYRVRAREARIIPDTVEEIRLIENLAEPGGDRLRRCLEEYHRRRCDKVTSLVQLLT